MSDLRMSDLLFPNVIQTFQVKAVRLRVPTEYPQSKDLAT
jgi:hypothetical protein